MSLSRLSTLLGLGVFGLVLGVRAGRGAGPEPGSSLGFSFTNVAGAAGLDALTVFGGKDSNRYLLETTGCGAAFFDYDGDGWQDLFLVNGTTLEGFPPGKAPTNHLYRNRRNGTFEDVTRKAGLVQGGWGQGVCAGDYDNDSHEDLAGGSPGRRSPTANRCRRERVARCYWPRRQHPAAR